MPARQSELAVITRAKDLAGGTLGGKTGKVTVEASVGDTIKLPGAPTRSGYTFKYWKGLQYAAGAGYKVEGDHSFMAVWEKNAAASDGTDKKSVLPATGDGSGPLAADAGGDGQDRGGFSHLPGRAGRGGVLPRPDRLLRRHARFQGADERVEARARHPRACGQEGQDEALVLRVAGGAARDRD